MIASSAQPASLFPALGGAPTVEGADPALSFQFSTLLARLSLTAPEAELVSDSPQAVAPEAVPEEDSGPIPDGLEEVAATLAAALAAVYAAAGQMVAPAFGRAVPGAPPPTRVPMPAASAPITPPPAQATPPATNAQPIAAPAVPTAPAIVAPEAESSADPEPSVPVPATKRPVRSSEPFPNLPEAIPVPAESAASTALAPTVETAPDQPASPRAAKWLGKLAHNVVRIARPAAAPFPEQPAPPPLALASAAEGLTTRLPAEVGAAPEVPMGDQPRRPAVETRAQGLPEGRVPIETVTAAPALSPSPLPVTAPADAAAAQVALPSALPETEAQAPAPLPDTNAPIPDQPAPPAEALPERPAPAPLTPSHSAVSAPAPTPTMQPTAIPAADAAPAQPVSSSEIVMSHHLDLAKDGEWLDRLARDIARTASHEAQLRFQLNPEHLGSLRVELANSADGTAIRLTADTEAARALLADAQPRLIAEARAQGLRITEAQVDLGQHGGQNQRSGHESSQAFVRIQQPGNDSPAPEPERSSAERYA